MAEIPIAPELQDNDFMPFGKYQKLKKRMIEVPAQYLLWLRDEGCNNPQVSRYIERNLEALKKEAGRLKR